MDGRIKSGHDAVRGEMPGFESTLLKCTVGFALAISAATILASPALAQRGASCHNGMSFPQFLSSLEQDAQKAGVSPRAISAAAPYMVYDQGIVNRDRGQRVFGQLFTQFAGRMASEARRVRGQQLIRQHAQAFARAEKEYGVPAAVITAFWALESDFGAVQGKLSTLRSLVSLAYDCRRAQMFHDETIAALKIIDRGDLTPTEMIGSWAGELGQTQFLPRHYYDYAVDYDGDGRRDMMHSAADVIGSTANYIATGLKWKRGEPWLQEVHVSADVPWDQADLTIKHPRSQWAAMGRRFRRRQTAAERQACGLAAAADGAQRPGIFGLRQFRRLYRVEQLADLFDHGGLSRHADRRRGADAKTVGAGGATLLRADQAFAAVAGKAGYDVGKIDGVLGQQSRSAVKAMQVKYGLPADSWPTAELLARMAGGAAHVAGPSETAAEPFTPRRTAPHQVQPRP